MPEQINILIKACQQDNRKAQRKLFQQFLPYVNVVVRRYLYDQNAVKDNVQEAFIKVFKNLKSNYNPERGAFKPWLRTITINQCIAYNKRNQSFDDIEDYSQTISVEPAIFEQFDEADLMRFLDEMPSVLKVVFNMFIIDGYSHAEIAETLNISEAASRKKVSRARAWVQSHIKINQFSNR